MASEAEPSLGKIITVHTQSDIHMPINSYEPTNAEYVQLHKATDILILQCMERYKLHYVRGTYRPSSITRDAFRMGFREPRDIERYGYHMPPNRLNDIKSTQTGGSIAVRRFSNEQWAVMNGGVSTFNGSSVPAKGCQGEAKRQLGAVGNLDENLAEKIRVQADQAAQADSRMRAVVARWSKCMAQSGYNYQTLDAAKADSRWHASEDSGKETPPVSETEIKTTQVDFNCRSEVNYFGIRLAVESAYQDRLIRKQSEQLRAVKESFQRQIRSAAKVLANG